MRGTDRRTYYRIISSKNLLTTFDDYTALSVPDPRGNGERITVYNLAAPKFGAVQLLDTNSQSNSRTYNGFEFGTNAQLPNGGRVLASVNFDRTRAVLCDVSDPNALRFCDETEFDVPFRTQAKLSAMYPLPGRLLVSATVQSIAGAPLLQTYVVTRAILPGLTQTSVTVPLAEPGSQYSDRLNQVDFRFSKTITTRKATLTPQLDVYNAFNASPVLREVTAFGPSLGRPQEILSGRLVRLGIRVDY